MSTSTEMGASFGALLQRHRLEAGLTQEALAERAGLSQRNVQNLERAVNRPLVDTARRLADALDLPAEERARFLTAATPPTRLRSASPTAPSLSTSPRCAIPPWCCPRSRGHWA